MMSALALMLVLVLAASVLLIIWIESNRDVSGHRYQTARILCVGYAGFVFVVLSVLGTGCHLGLMRTAGSPLLDAEQQRKIQHNGYYIAPGDTFVFRGVRQDKGFYHGIFEQDEYLALLPNLTPTSTVISDWQIRYAARTLPLRFDGRCVNLPESWWLDPNDTFTIVRTDPESDGEFIAVRWESKKNILGQRRDRYYFSMGRQTAGDTTYRYRDLELTRRIYKEARNFGVMLRLAPRTFRDSVDINALAADWWDVLNGVTWIRETKRNTDSRMGVFVAPRLFETSLENGNAVSFFKNGSFLPAPSLEASETTLPTGVRIVYGIGYRDAFELDSLQSRLQSNTQNKYFATLDFRRPPTWDLPPDPDTTFIITSSRSYIPLDGFVINTMGLAHPFYTKAHFTSERDTLVVNDGKEARKYPLEMTAFFGDDQQGALLSLQPARVPTPVLPGLGLPLTPHVGLWIVFFLLLATVGFSRLMLADGKSMRMRLDLAWTLIWGLTLTILIVRLILAYRIALLPPEDATPLEITNVFHKSFHVSFWAVVFIPAMLLAGRWIAQKQNRAKTSKKTGALSTVLTRLRTMYHTLASWPQRLPETTGSPASQDRRLFGVAFLLTNAALLTILLMSNVNIWWSIGWILVVSVLFLRLKVDTVRALIYALLRQWLLLIPLIWVVLGKVFGANESFLSIRINIGTHLLLVACLAGSLARVIHRPARYDKRMTMMLAAAAIVLCMVLIGDRGFIIYGLSFFLFFALLVLWNYQPPKKARVNWPATLVSGAIVLIPIMLFVGSKVPLGDIPLIGSLSQTFTDTEGNLYYRIASVTDTEEDLLLAHSHEQGISMDQLLRSSHQNWQMLLYAATGADEPIGFGQAPLTDRGMTYPTSITDCAFAIYLVSEHGRWVAFLFLWLYVGLGIACFYGGWYLSKKSPKYRGLILCLIGAFFACNTLYMASANLGLIFFTGQNIPLLGLYSWSDVAQGGFLLMMVGMLLCLDIPRYEAKGSPRAAMRHSKNLSVFWPQVVFLGLIILTPFILLFRMDALDKSYTRDHDFAPAVFDLIRQREWEYDPVEEKLIPQGRNPLREIEQRYREQFERRPNKFDETGGLYYVVRRVDEVTNEEEYQVQVNRHFFTLRSPFNLGQYWDATIYASGEANQPTLTTLGQEFRIRLGPEQGYKKVTFGRRPSAEEATGGVVFTDGSGGRILDLERRGDSLVVSPLGTNWRIYKEGDVLDKASTLEFLDLIVMERGYDENLRTQSLLYLGTPPPILAATQWRNGRYQHIYPEGDAFPAVYTIMQAGDWAVARAASEQDQKPSLPEPVLSLTIDLDLQQQLQSVLNTFAATHRPYGRNDPLRARILAASVLDAFSGEVLALPSWPYPDPNAPDFDQDVRRAAPSQQTRLLRNHNLGRHVIGSTIKPLLFTAVASGLWDESPVNRTDLSQMTVYSRPTTDRPTLDRIARDPNRDRIKQPHSHLGGIRLETWWDSDWGPGNLTIDATTFLVNSRNYYAGMVGMMGMLLNKSDLPNVLVPSAASSADLTLGTSYKLDLTKALESPFTLVSNSVILNKKVPRTLLFRGLDESFPAFVVDESQRLGDVRREAWAAVAQNYLPFLAPDNRKGLNLYLDEVIPEPVILDPNGEWDRGRIRGDLISLLLGGSINRWNNVAMAEAAARLATGRQVTASLQQRTDSLQLQIDSLQQQLDAFELQADSLQRPPDSLQLQIDSLQQAQQAPLFEDLSAPLGLKTWRNKHIIDPMEGAGRIGTAARIGLAIRQRLGSRANKYRLLFKTGTLQERGRFDPRSELLMFVVGQWDSQTRSFVPGKTLSGYLYMQESRGVDEPFLRNDFAPELLIPLIEYLESRPPAR